MLFMFLSGPSFRIAFLPPRNFMDSVISALQEEHLASVFYNILPAQHPSYPSISLSSDLYTPTSTHTDLGHVQTAEEGDRASDVRCEVYPFSPSTHCLWAPLWNVIVSYSIQHGSSVLYPQVLFNPNIHKLMFYVRCSCAHVHNWSQEGNIVWGWHRTFKRRCGWIHFFSLGAHHPDST